jgi:ATP-dependent protease ClpP protease subunit
MGRRSRLRAAHAQHRIVNTALLDTVVGVHHTATVDKTWDAGANEKRLPSPVSVATAKKVYAWYDSEAVDAGELPKTSCKFPHHDVAADGTPGAANLAACRNGLARLDSANVPDGDRDGIRRHLQAHLDDGKGTSDKAPSVPRANVRARARDQLAAHGREGKPGQTWYRIENLVQNPGTACIYLYGEIGMWGIEAVDFIQDLNQVTASSLELHINSMGGEVFEGIAILNALRAHRATITTYVDGLAASIASVIAMAGSQVVMSRNSTMMVHEPHIIAIGSADELRSTADMVELQANNIAAIYAEKAGGTAESWRTVMRAETWYSADEAVAAGLADEVDTTGLVEQGTNVVEEMAASFDLSVFRYAGRDKAPAPKAIAEPEPEAPAEEPVVEPAAVEPEPAVVEEPAEPEAPVVAAEEPAPVEPPVSGPTNEWAALMGGLLDPAPSTVDELLHALMKEGTSA